MPSAQSSPAGDGSRVARFLFVAALVVVPLAIDPGGIVYGATVFAKSALAQLLVYSSAAAACLALLRGKTGLRVHRIQLLALGLIAWIVTVTALSPYWMTAIVGTAKRHEGALTAIAYVAAFLLGIELLRRVSDMRLLLAAVAASGGVAAAYGLIQFLGGDPLDWGFTWASNHSFSTMSNPDFYGGYAALTCLVSLGLALSSADRSRTWGWSALAALQGVTVVTSSSQGAWIGFAAGAIVFSLLYAWTKPGRVRAAALVAAAALVVTGVALAWVVLGSSGTGTARPPHGAGALEIPSVRVRLELARIALAATADRPVVGYGPDTLALVAGPKATRALASLVEPGAAVDSAHNVFFQTAAELGIPGLLMLAGLLVWAFVVAARTSISLWRVRPHSALLLAGGIAGCAACVVSFVFNPTNVGGTLVFWGVLGAVVSPAAVAKPSADRTAGFVAAVSVCGVLSVACALTVVPLTLAERSATVLNDPNVAPDAQRAAALYAAKLNPLEADFPAGAAKAEADMLVGAAYANPADTARARELLDASLAHARTSERMQPDAAPRKIMRIGLLLVGAQYVDRAMYADAIETASKAAAAMPFELPVRYWQARALAESGDSEAAEKVLERVLAVRARYPDAALLLARIQRDSGRTQDALGVLDRADPEGTDPAVQQAIDELEASPTS